jgi:RNA polymerase primary sigma factor
MRKMGNADDQPGTGSGDGALSDGLPYLEVGDYGEDKSAGMDLKDTEGTDETGKDDGGESSDDALSLYLDELRSVPEFSAGEEEQLIRKAHSGDAAARKRLTEGNLKFAASLIADFKGEELNVQELIGEANLALVNAVSACISGSGETAPDRGRLHEEIRKTVLAALKISAEQQKSQNMSDTEVVRKANLLSEVTTVMAGELGRQPTIPELAERMHTDEETIRSLLKMSMQAMES